ncbi:hypothetical protein AB0F73_00845 [Micromonospora purpureochromogenes]|uniref:hypothetical protein n=1 Tax=Micromonospora purpureochromogenes TaxID=47872 RepID=UPI0033E688F7
MDRHREQPYVYNLALTSDHKVSNVLSFDAADSDVAASTSSGTRSAPPARSVI